MEDCKSVSVAYHSVPAIDILSFELVKSEGEGVWTMIIILPRGEEFSISWFDVNDNVYMILKWIFDRLVSLIGLLFLWPVLLIVAVLVKVKMPGGSAFFVQKRVGKDGKLFDCHKFRTMTVKHNGSTVSVAGDSRITPFGATLRHYKIDELPGLWDVLIGNMSFVGPRPDVPGYADKLQGSDRDVLRLRPGITGPATLKYRLEDEYLSNARALVSSFKIQVRKNPTLTR